MSWLTFQSSFLLTCETPVYAVYFVRLSQVSPVQFHLHNDSAISTMSSESKAARGRSNLGSVNCAGLVKHFLENSYEQSLTILGITGMLDSDLLDSVVHSFMCPVYLTSVGVDLIFSIVLVCLYTFGCSVPISCIIQ